MGSSKKPPPPVPSRKPPPPAPSRKPPPPAPAKAQEPKPAQKPAVPPPPLQPRKGPTWVKQAPAPRSTIEVDTSWLLHEEAQAIPPSAPVPGSMRPRRDTMEVKLEWLEESPTRKSSVPITSKKGPPPLPRDETPDEPPTKHGRKVPPTLPPEELAKRPSRAVRAVRKGPPPIPREEPDDEPKTRRSKRP